MFDYASALELNMFGLTPRLFMDDIISPRMDENKHKQATHFKRWNQKDISHLLNLELPSIGFTFFWGIDQGRVSWCFFLPNVNFQTVHKQQNSHCIFLVISIVPIRYNQKYTNTWPLQLMWIDAMMAGLKVLANKQVGCQQQMIAS